MFCSSVELFFILCEVAIFQPKVKESCVLTIKFNEYPEALDENTKVMAL